MPRARPGNVSCRYLISADTSFNTETHREEKPTVRHLKLTVALILAFCTFGVSRKCLPALADLRFLVGLYGTISSLRYGGARLLRALKVNNNALKVIRCSTGNQCSSIRTGQMCAARGCPATRHAAQF